jgi:replication-associated recombination protein RarA
VNLFDEPGFEILKLRAPLAGRLRPKTLNEVVRHLTGESGPLRAALSRGERLVGAALAA